MPSTSIRPDYTVTFKDVNGTTLYQTGDASKIYLTALDEKTPAVKAIKVNVPARDGALDLTEAVAGRPLYGNRQIDMTLSIVGTNHPDAVDKVRTMRRKLHGVVCKVETPDNILPGTPPTQGWYLGRVSITSVTYPGEAAVVKLTVDAQPWIYYGTGTVTLAHSASTAIGSAKIASSDQTRIADMLLDIEQPTGGWNKDADSPVAGRPPSEIAVVASSGENLMVYGSMGIWASWSKVYDGGSTFDADWSANPSVIDYTSQSGQAFFASSGTGKAARVLMICNVTGTDTGMLVTDMEDVFTVKVEAVVTNTGSTSYGVSPGIRFFVQGAYTAASPDDGSGGIIVNGETPAYQSVTIDQYGIASASMTVDPKSVVPDGSGNASGFIVIGIETTWVSVSGSVSVRLHKSGTSILNVGTQTVTMLTAPEPLYSASGLRNIIHITPYGTSMNIALRTQPGSGTASEITPHETIPMQQVLLSGNAEFVRAYGITSKGWKPLKVSGYIYPWTTATFDAGDMPTTITATIGSPTAFEKNGNKVIMAESGQLPYALSGSTATLDYMVMGSSDGSLTYEQGTV